MLCDPMLGLRIIHPDEGTPISGKREFVSVVINNLKTIVFHFTRL